MLPRLRIVFIVDYNILLRKTWDAEEHDDGIHYYAPHQIKRDVHMTELVAPPSQTDREYVDRYCTRKLEVKVRDAIVGSLSEGLYEREKLIPHHVAKEPALARVLMEEHYQVYKTWNEMQRSRSGVRDK